MTEQNAIVGTPNSIVAEDALESSLENSTNKGGSDHEPVQNAQMCWEYGYHLAEQQNDDLPYKWFASWPRIFHPTH
jgi:hypothetical protein